MTDHQLWFTSPLYRIEPGEDAATNPGCYGKHLAGWLADQLAADGRDVEPLIPEDWGWCVMVQREPFVLWVGVSNVRDEASTDHGTVPRGHEVVWSCFVTAELPLLRRLWRRPDTAAATQALFDRVRALIGSEVSNQLCDAP